MTKENIVVFGTGYVGCVSAACLASLGHRVTGIDRDPCKVNSILEGHAPFHEPGLEELIAANVAEGRLTATTALEEELAQATIILMCVGTPSLPRGDQDLSQLRRALFDIVSASEGRERPFTVVIRSTVAPGTCEKIVEPILADLPCSVVSNPEFLREGVAVSDFMAPGLLVVGGNDVHAVRQVADMYSGLPVEAQIVSLRAAEMIKYACNAFHAVKVGFANEIGALSGAMGVDASEVMAILGSDTKLNASVAYLKPGFAFGGSCLPKDLRALTFRARENHLEIPILSHTLASNSAHLKRATDAVLDTGNIRLGVIGLAFKEDTDDLRESPALAMLETLLGKGRSVKVFDPNIQLGKIHGANRAFALQAVPHIGRLISSLEDVLNWAEALILVTRPSSETALRIADSRLPVLDLMSGPPIWRPAPSKAAGYCAVTVQSMLEREEVPTEL